MLHIHCKHPHERYPITLPNKVASTCSCLYKFNIKIIKQKTAFWANPTTTVGYSCAFVIFFGFIFQYIAQCFPVRSTPV